MVACRYLELIKTLRVKIKKTLSNFQNNWEQFKKMDYTEHLLYSRPTCIGFLIFITMIIFVKITYLDIKYYRFFIT